jgi:hypothetical protein
LIACPAQLQHLNASNARFERHKIVFRVLMRMRNSEDKIYNDKKLKLNCENQ